MVDGSTKQQLTVRTERRLHVKPRILVSLVARHCNTQDTGIQKHPYTLMSKRNPICFNYSLLLTTVFQLHEIIKLLAHVRQAKVSRVTNLKTIPTKKLQITTVKESLPGFAV